MNKRFVLFDFDGVIVNTEESNARYFEKALASFGIYLSEEDKHKLIGTKDSENVIRLLSRAPKKVTFEELQLKRKEVGNTYENGDISPMPGLISLIENFREKGLKIGIVSSTSTRLIIIALNRMKMMNLFDVIICGDMCTKGKPDPEGYKKAMSLLKAKPEECIVFEDSKVGIHAGKIAGAQVVAYKGSGIPQNVEEADFAIDSYEDCKKILDEITI
ncbi:haloacid dehalogenase [Clostridium sp. DMHC 10]|uniref:HAD family hydrolase n=1 Tax=Clostridium sp. DMHC 10 TaxID=747377 RepID=UPI00069F5CB1|nr:HAD family phosphatase [Clostridium sp. DMHC 10]KOF57514.1 haloacid dehalogenase [Clostridium sp. DMHC 10]